jgi:hypothetical protein
METGTTFCTSHVKTNKIQTSCELDMSKVNEHLYALSISVVAQSKDVYLVFGAFGIPICKDASVSFVFVSFNIASRHSGRIYMKSDNG